MIYEDILNHTLAKYIVPVSKNGDTVEAINASFQFIEYPLAKAMMHSEIN